MTVELNMSEVKTEKPHLHMVDLNLLTVFDKVMQEQNITHAAHRPHLGNIAACG